MKILKGEERKKFIEEDRKNLPEGFKDVEYPEEIKILETEQDYIDEIEMYLLLGYDAEALIEASVLGEMCKKYPNADGWELRQYTQTKTSRLLNKAIKQMEENKNKGSCPQM